MSLGVPTKKEQMISLDNMSNTTKDVLESWLKFGTVFLVYRLCTYFFFDECNTPFFDETGVKFCIFILLGFTFYFLFVKPYLKMDIEHPIMRKVKDDTLMFGTVLVSSHVLEQVVGGTNDYFSIDWLKRCGVILLGFALYRVVIDPFIPRDIMTTKSTEIVDDWLQFGTLLIVMRLFEGKSLIDQQWILTVLFVLLGFTGYHVLTKKIITVN
jgi:hypothetical protein